MAQRLDSHGVALDPEEAFLLGSHERVNLAVPILLLALLPIELYWGWNATASWFAAVSTFGALHHLISLYIVGGSEELKQWAIRASGGKPSLIAGAVAVFSASLFFAFLYSLGDLRSYGGNLELVLLGFVVLDAYFISSFHMLQQHKGLSLLYNKHALPRLTEKDRHELKLWEARERRALWCILAGVSLSAFFFGFHKMRTRIGIDPTFAHTMERVALALAALAAAAYLFIAIRTSRMVGRAKWIFAMRMLLWPLYAVSAAAQASIRIVHGVEYYFIYRKIESHRRYSWSNPTLVLLAASFLVYAFVLCFRAQGFAPYYFGQQILWRQWNGFSWKTLAYSVYGTLNILHIVLDSLVFRMSRPEARAATMRHILS